MKKNIFIYCAVILIALALALGWTLLTKKTPTTNTASPLNSAQETAKKIALAIDYGDGASNNFIVEYISEMTAYDALKKISDEKNIILETKDYADMGLFIEKIGNKKNGDDAKYWLYSVNGKQPAVASDKMMIQPGATIEFKFEKSPF